MSESVDSDLKVTTFQKGTIIEKIFKDIPGVSISKAEEIFQLIKKYSNMKGRKKITNDDIEKAYEALGLGLELDDDIKNGKGCSTRKGEDFDEKEQEEDKLHNHPEPDGDEDEDGNEPDDDDDTEKGDDDSDDDDEDFNDDDDDDSNDEDEAEKGCGKTMKKSMKKAIIGGNRFDRIEKAISDFQFESVQNARALGVMLKNATNKLKTTQSQIDELMDITKAQEETISDLRDQIEEFGDETPAPKSIIHSRPVERRFKKSMDNDFTQEDEKPANNVFSMSKNPAAISEILDQATFGCELLSKN